MAKKMQELGRNVKVQQDGDTLHIEVDLSEAGEPSGSGKTVVIGTTRGNKPVGDVFVGLNVYRYSGTKKKK